MLVRVTIGCLRDREYCFRTKNLIQVNVQTHEATCLIFLSIISTCGWSQEIDPCNTNVRCEACCACVRACARARVCVCVGEREGGGRYQFRPLVARMEFQWAEQHAPLCRLLYLTFWRGLMGLLFERVPGGYFPKGKRPECETVN
jgi:hypothetical protein